MTEKTIEIKQCSNCWINFNITDKDLEFYSKVSPIFDWKKYLIPSPTYCSDCRQQRRVAFRNERSLYRRKCSSSGKEIISIYSPDKPYIVYDQNVWWTDAYNPLDYGRDFDFTSSFFEQYQKLMQIVPLPTIQNSKSQNSEYTNYSRANKDCYLCVGTWESENCYYSYRVVHCKSVVDCYDLYNCESCYECVSSKNLYSCLYSKNCHDCSFCYGCVDLYNKRYYIFNQQYTKEEYEKRIKTISYKQREEELYILMQTAQKSIIINVENSTGNYLIDCKGCDSSYTLKSCEYCSYCKIGEHDKDCQDSNFFDNNELQYDSTNLQSNYKCAFGNLVRYTQHSYYLMMCFNSRNCFGCVGLKGQEYCILNKQYSKQEYEKLVPKIIDHMRATWERGEYFPISMSPFAYNETVAGERYPLVKDKVFLLWYKRKNQEDKNYHWPIYLPLNILEYLDETKHEEILNGILKCKETDRPYRIIKQELWFYLNMWIPIPTKHPDQRHKERLTLMDMTK